MRKNKKDKYSDVNNSMEKEDSNEESEKKNKKAKKNKKEKKEKNEKKSKNNNTFNILDEIKKEDESNQKEKILEEVNNTMIRGSKEEKQYEEKERKKEREKDESFREEVKKENNKDKNKDKEKTKQNKNNKKANNKISDTIDEITSELNEQYNLEIENIFEINKKFNYPKDSPVFYIKDDSSNKDLYSYPLSNIEIKDLLKKRQIKPFLVKVKLIDIFTMKKYEPFLYFDFNDILVKNWSKNVEYSSLFLNQYNNLFEQNKKKDKEKKLEISFNTSEFMAYPQKEKKLRFEENKKEEKNKKQNEEKKNDMTLSFNISKIDYNGYNDLSLSIIKQLEGINLTKKKMEKIASIIEEVDEEEWTEVKGKKKEKEKEKIPSNYIVGLNESRQIQEPEEFVENKKKNKGKKKKKQFVNFNNKFAAFKVDYGSDEEKDEK